MAAVRSVLGRWLKMERSRAAVAPPAQLPGISAPLLRWFTWYCGAYMRRHFHALRVSGVDHLGAAQGRPLVIFANHASWWDPIVGLVLKRTYFPARRLFAPIDAGAIARYAFFRKLGFFGVEPDSVAGVKTFLRTATGLLRDADTVLALTPQGRFADVRERPVRFLRGIGHLALLAPEAAFLPVAVEYVFWEERLPEVLVQFGEPIVPRAHGLPGGSARAWSEVLASQLVRTQEILAEAAQRRTTTDFQAISRGRTGPGGVYDVWRGLRARLRGERFVKAHGTK